MSELSELVAVLYPKTMEGRLKWKLEGESRLITIQGINRIELTDLGGSGISITIRNGDGIPIASEEFEIFVHEYDALSDIFRKAKRDHFKVDETILDLKTRLEAL